MKLQTISIIPPHGMFRRVSTLCLLLSLVHINSIHILYLQENQVTLTSPTATVPQATISTFYNGWTSTTGFTISIWIKKLVWNPSTSVQSGFFHVSDNTSSFFYNGRVMMAFGQISADFLFSLSTPSDQLGHWDPWGGGVASTMIPLGEWAFLALSVNNTANMQYGFRYHLQSNQTLDSYYSSTQPSDILYSVTPSTVIYWGATQQSDICNCTLQYVRFYIDYVPSSPDQMISLALMNPQSTLYLVKFATDSTINNNQTSYIQYFTNTTQGSATATLGTSIADTVEDPNISAYEVLNCRPGTSFFYSISVSIQNGLVIGMNIKPYSGQSNIQNIFAIRDSSNNWVSLKGQYDPSTGHVIINSQNGSSVWTQVMSSSASLVADSWNRLVVELVQAQPTEFGVGYCSGRIWINGVGTNRVYFGNFSNGTTLFSDHSSPTLDLCSTKVSGTSTRDASHDGYYDLSSLLWFNGAEGAYVNSSDPTCALSAFINTNEAACLQCQPGYYLNGTNCISSCPSGTFLDNSNSCQSCWYGRYYIGNGLCTDCLSDGQSLLGSTCVICDASCKKCTGGSATQCTSCYTGAYLLQSNNSCVSCTVNGYYVDTSTGYCTQCDSSCQTCSGNLATNCLTCNTGVYLMQSNNSCVSCTVNGYYGNTSTGYCTQCDSSCKTCSGSLPTNCLSCNAGMYFLSANNSCVSCTVNGYYVDTSTSYCTQCDSSCKTCSGTLATNCLTCYTGQYFLQADNSCVSCTVNGYYPNTTTGYCNQCDTSCKTCSGSLPTNCLTCKTTTYFVQSNNTCFSCSVNGYYADTATASCKQCDSSCKTCNGDSSSSCTSCYAGYSLTSNYTCSNTTSATVYNPWASLPSATVSTIDEASNITSAAIQAQTVSTAILPMISKGATTTAVLLVDFISDVLIFRYINVAFPDNFMAFCMTIYTNFLPNIYNPYSNDIPNCPTGKFNQFQMSTVFLANEGNTLDREFFALVVIGASLLLPNAFFKFPKLKKICKRIQKIFMWNVFLTFYIGDFGDFFLFGLIQLLENVSDSWFARYCLAVTIAILSSYVIMIPAFAYLLNRRKPITMKAIHHRDPPSWIEVPSSISMISEGLNQKHWLTRNFMLVIMAENAIVDLMMLFAQDYGLIQAAVYTGIILSLWIVTTFIYKPFQERTPTFLYGMNSFVKIIMGVLALVIGINEHTEFATQNQIDNIGMALIVLVLSVVSINALISIVAIISLVIQKVRSCRKRNKHNQVQQAPEMNGFSPAIDLDFALHTVSPSPSSLRDRIDPTDRSPKVMVKVIPQTPVNPVKERNTSNLTDGSVLQHEDIRSGVSTSGLNLIKAETLDVQDHTLPDAKQTNFQFFNVIKRSVYKKLDVLRIDISEAKTRKEGETD